MKAMLIDENKNLVWSDVPDPVIKEDEVLVKIYAAALNRADLLQRQGKYPSPAGCPEWMGLEIAGKIVEKGKNVTGWEVGDSVCALLGGGGYAQYAAVKYDMLMPIPKGLTMEEASALPEAYATSYLNLVIEGHLEKGQTAFVPAGASGLASVAIPMAKALLPVLLSGLFAIILHYAFTYSALQLTDSSKTAILKQVGALFYVCFSSLFFKEDRLTWQKLAGVLLGFAGIIAINANADGVSFNVGDALIIAASFCTVFSNIISKNVFKTVNPVTSTGISQLFGGIVLLVAGIFMGGGMAFGALPSNLIMIYICIASIFSYCIWFGIVKNGELSKLFIIKFAEPLFACVFGALILGENIFKIQYLIAFLLIAGGIYAANK